jgi:hypothetical protein
MNVEFDKSFEKSLGKIHDPRVFQRIERIITHLENSSSLSHKNQILKNFQGIRIISD